MPVGLSKEADQTLALVLLVKEILTQVDEVASLLAENHQARTSRLLLREMCSVLRELEPEMQERYLDVLMTLSSKEPPSKPVPSPEYVEAVVPAKRKLISNLRDRLVEAA